jgi:hypothetical protein
MKIFISYSSSKIDFAERLAYSLQGEGHQVFFDRVSLPAGEEYDSRIRDGVQQSDLFIFLVSPESLSLGSYALTELEFAQQKWESPSGHLLPVMTTEMDLKLLPPYLSAVTVLRPKGNAVAEVLSAVSKVRDRRKKSIKYWFISLIVLMGVVSGIFTYYARNLSQEPASALKKLEPVKLSSQVGNIGWILNFDILEEDFVREIFYKFEDEKEFKSTGFSQGRNPKTGHSIANYSVNVPYLKGTRTLLVKYIDSTGREKGPYTVIFDATEQIVGWTKNVLESTKNAWVGFKRTSEEEITLYFTHLISYKNGLKEIQYSVDDESLSKRVQFERDWSRAGAPGIGPNDELYVDIPNSSEFVYVKLIFIDGSEWPAKKFLVAQTL